uniref:PI3K/PI4K catalytic domain-containing protein n=1 Tax=Tetradesmus obliquus TaxID=3088 RepID=A0A383W900_TETOB|eukprot:jgi/Sobl393_1/15755/SZX73166.1
MHRRHGSTDRHATKEWELLWALFTTQDTHQQQLLCAELLQLPAERINRYLLEYVYLAVSRPSGPLEHAITELCGRSFNTAVQVSWLLLALLQDQPGNRHIRQFRDACEHAALMGGAPSHPHYLHTFNQVQPYQQQQQASPRSNSTPATPGADSDAASSIPASPFAHTAACGFSASSPATPQSARAGSPGGVASASSAISLALAAASGGSLSSSHRFRDSLDLELMRHASQDLAATAATAGGTPGKAAAGQQQQAGKPDSPSHQQQQQQDQQLSLAGSGLRSIRTHSRPSSSNRPGGAAGSSSSSASWAVPGSVTARYACFEEYLAAREYELYVELGPGQGVSALIAASHAAALANGPQGAAWLVSHEEELLSTSMLLEMPPRSPRHAAGRDSFLASLDFVDALCETSANLTRFPQEERRRVLRKCLGRINQEVMDAAEQGVAVRYPIGGCRSRVLRLLVNEAAILNSRDKAPFLLMLEVQQDQDFVDEVLPGSSSSSRQGNSAADAGAVAAALLLDADAGVSVSTDDVQVTSSDQQQHQQHAEQHQQHDRLMPSRQQQLLEQLQHQPHHQQQRQRPHSSKGGGVGASPLSRGSSPAPGAAPQASQSSKAATAAPAVVSAGMQEAAAAAAEHSISRAAIEADSDVEEQQQQQQQEQQQEQRQASPEHWSSSSYSSSRPASRQELQLPGTPGLDSSAVVSPVEATAAAATARSVAAPTAAEQAASKAAATAEPPTAVEMQMQEAAAVLRGEKLVRLHLRFLDTGLSSSSSSRDVKKHSNDDSNNSSDAVEGPWLFGELPASSSSGDMRRAASRDFAATSSTAAGASRQRTAAAAAAGRGQLLQVHLEVVAAAPVVQHLALHCRKGRRLPSLEAIDIIAGKLGKAAIPPPTEIGPPLQLPGELSSSSSSSMDGDAECIPYVTGEPASSSHLKTVEEAEVAGAAAGSAAAAAAAETEEEQSAAPAPAAAGNGQEALTAASGGSHDVVPAQSSNGVSAPELSAGASSRSSRTSSSSSDGGGSVRIMPNHDGWQDVASTAAAAASPKQRQRKQQQQQQKASSGWWGFLRKQQPAAAAAAHVDQLVTQEQQQQAAESAEAAAERLAQQAEAVYGESWKARCARVRASSPFGCRPGWGLAGVIVKSGDDCRQELLALQLIRELGDIWAAAGLPLWVLPFEVLVTSAGTALIQLIPDSTSVHSIKQRSAAAAANAAAAAAASSAASNGAATTSPAAAAAGSSSGGVSLSEHFFSKWRRGSLECLAAQRRFVESLAAYSLVTYLLQVKDRHNGNIMMDSSGRLVHIDFGFLLSNAPGGGWLAFEAAPMKLSRELMEVMDSNSEGQPSELFDYFKVLCIQGFLAARKERQRLTRLVTIMAHCARPSTTGAGAGAAPSGNIPTGSGSSSTGAAAAAAAVGAGQAPSWPCFRAGPERVLAALEGRFVPQLSEAGCVQHVLRLISGSLDAWSTRQYDYYQRVLNGIL